jgi:predicted permease
LGIGATTTIFSLAYGVLFRPLPYRDAGSLVLIGAESTFGGQRQPANFSARELDDWRARTHRFDGIAGYAIAEVALETDQGTQPLKTECVSSNFFRLVGTPMVHGRALGPADDRSAIVVISTNVWRRAFGGDPRVVGRTATLNGQPFTIVGVTPSNFQLPKPQTELWIPLEYAKANGVAPWLNVARGGGLLMIARLAPAATLAEARSDLQDAHRALVQDGGHRGDTRDITVTKVADAVAGSARPALIVLLVAVGLALLVACVNVMHLLLARQSSRGRELALRGALGASRIRLVGEALTETALLASTGGLVGIVLAAGAVRILVWLEPVGLPRLDAIRLDGPVLAFAVGTSLIAAIAAGLVPALRASREDAIAVLNATARDVGRGPGRRLRESLAVAELALSIVLLVGSALLARSFIRLLRTDVGARTDHAESALLDLSIGRSLSAADQRTLANELVARARTIPGVRDAALGAALPPAGEQVRFTLTDLPTAHGVPVTPDFFRALGVPLLRGRVFTDRDGENEPRVMIMGAGTAALLFGDHPLGHTLSLPSPTHGNVTYTLVGVVGDVRYKGLATPPGGAIYLSFAQQPWSTAYLVARTDGDPDAIASDLRRAVLAVDRHVGVLDVRSLDAMMSQQVAQPRFRAAASLSVAILAVLLATTGVYGVIGYSVSQRTSEFGVRLALGASGADIARLVMHDGIRFAVAGCALGLVGAYVLTSALAAFLYGIASTDLASYATATAVVLAAAALAAAIPARRALRVDPLIALRLQ